MVQCGLAFVDGQLLLEHALRVLLHETDGMIEQVAALHSALYRRIAFAADTAM